MAHRRPSPNYDQRRLTPEESLDRNQYHQQQNHHAQSNNNGYRQGGRDDFFEKRRIDRENAPVRGLWPKSPTQAYGEEKEKKHSHKKSKNKHKSSSSKKHKSSSHRHEEDDSDDESESSDHHRSSRKKHKSSSRNEKDKKRRRGRRRVRPITSTTTTKIIPGPSRETIPIPEPEVIREDTDHDDDDDGDVGEGERGGEVGPMPYNHATGKAMDPKEFGRALRPGEGSAMAAFIEAGERIPRRGEIGLTGTEIEKFENVGYVMSGSRHRRMNAVRIRKENQVISAEEKRGILKMQAEEKAKREGQIISSFRELVDTKLQETG
ncbi:hypothetical protein PSHT_07586 [Puccinia striiformis]|uniref:NF-kappa-B-activating protein C-terminal domain-containing protein n=1 Tax=Puccinia striiformis TaxID=27350 RepID=A0A2S4VWS6_9BASI|nr:hypothetical protein PSHT_07586 [Puccinia striiformis]